MCMRSYYFASTEQPSRVLFGFIIHNSFFISEKKIIIIIIIIQHQAHKSMMTSVITYKRNTIKFHKALDITKNYTNTKYYNIIYKRHYMIQKALNALIMLLLWFKWFIILFGSISPHRFFCHFCPPWKRLSRMCYTRGVLSPTQRTTFTYLNIYINFLICVYFEK